MALSKDKNRTVSPCPSYAKGTFAVVSAATIYQGSLVGESSSTGTARALVAQDNFIGINVFNQVANPSGGSLSVDVQMEGVLKGVSVTGASGNADIGDAVYAADDDTLTKTSTNNTKIGHIVGYNANTGLFDVYFISDYLLVT